MRYIMLIALAVLIIAVVAVSCLRQPFELGNRNPAASGGRSHLGSAGCGQP